MNIYLVASGHYSDFSIEAVFSTKEKAEEFINWFNSEQLGYWSDSLRILTYTLDPETVREAREGYMRYQVTMLKNGDVEEVRYDGTDNVWTHSNYRVWFRKNTPAYFDEYIENALVVETNALSPEHAIKIANEYRVQSIAQNEWEDENDL